MKSRRNRKFILLMLVFSLALLIACEAKIAVSPAAENTIGTTKEVKITEAPVQPSIEVKPSETQKPTEAAPTSEEQPTQENNSNKAALKIEGSGIENSTVMTLDELKGMKDAYVEEDFFSLNSYGTKEYFSFKGIKLSAILKKAVLKKTAAIVRFVASDGYEQEITIEQALKEDYIDEQNSDKKYPIIIAWHENGTDYDVQKVAPFRLVIGQSEPGDVNKPKWVQNVAKIIVE